MTTEHGDWRRRRWEATHRRIYDVAMELFGEHGFEQVSTAQIAKRAGVSAPTFYAHYRSKEHLVIRLPTADDIAAVLGAAPAEIPVGQRIRQAVAEFFPESDAADLLVRWRIVATTPSLRRRAAEFERFAAELVAAALLGRGEAPDPGESVLINAYLAAITAGVLAWAESGGDRGVQETVGEALDALEAVQRR